MTLAEKYLDWDQKRTLEAYVPSHLDIYFAGAAAMAEIMAASAAYKDPSSRRERILLAMIQCDGFRGMKVPDLVHAAHLADEMLDKGQDRLPVSKGGLHND